jgi:hypothetical protein
VFGKYLVFISAEALTIITNFCQSVKENYISSKKKFTPSKNELTCQCWNRGQDCALSGADEHSPVQILSVCLAALTPVPGASSCVQILVHHPSVVLDSFHVAPQLPGGQYQHVSLSFNAETGDEQKVQHLNSVQLAFDSNLQEEER